ncbi:hypothetical protein [Bacillus marasmi]|uniref:hypothetical protein n=1 Tax=Bacillus marasmi TaxID=1926279 RepID=UPI001FE2AB92|nr:hypothetical protein [Bacillus marasmi]
MKKILAVMVVIVVGIVGFSGYILAKEGLEIEVKNQTNKEISGLYFTYDKIKSNIKIPSIASGKKYTLNINPNENSNDDFNEAALKLEYRDNKGQLHTEHVIGYFEKGYTGEAVITIKSEDKNGKLYIDVTDQTSLY